MFGALSLALVASAFRADPFRPDYSVFWTASQIAMDDPSKLYETEYVTAAQSWLASPANGPRPWAYPPTALLIFLPFALLPFWLSYLLWNAASLAAYLMACRRLLAGWRLAATLISPPVVFATLSGQTSLLLAAATISGIAILGQAPILAGMLLGAAAAVKPQALILAPIALIAGRHWRAFGSFIGTGMAALAASLMFGFTAWIDWFFGLREFSLIVEELGLHQNGIALRSAAMRLGVGEFAVWTIQGAGVFAGIAFAWWAFRRDGLLERIAGLMGGGLLCSPYAMGYELAVLVPVGLALLFSNRPWGIVGGLPLTATMGWFTIPALLAATILEDREASATS